MDPTHRDIPYGDSPSQTYDLYLAEGDGPRPVYMHIHGGGFARGDKANVRASLVALNLRQGVSVASINYRLSDEAKAPAAMHDAARALQHLRHHATKFNLDPQRIAAGGPSAGAGISLWLAFHADLAKRDAADPIARQSTRLAAAVPNDAQTSYDPRFIRDYIGPQAAQSSGMLDYYGVAFEDIDNPKWEALFTECSPLTHLTADAPPVLVWYWTFDVPRDQTMSTRDGIHHPQFGRILKQRMDALGCRCELHYRENAPDPTDDEAVVAYYHQRSARFIWRIFGIEPAENNADADESLDRQPHQPPLE